MKILYEDNDIIVCYKEAGIPVQSARIGMQDMVSMLNNHLADTLYGNGYGENGVKTVENSSTKARRRGKLPEKEKKSEQWGERKAMPEIYVVHRLDQPVEGVIVFAKNKKAASGLSRQVSDGTMKKTYHAVCCVGKDAAEKLKRGENRDKEQEQEYTTLVDYLVKDGRSNSSFAADKNRKDAKRAELRFRIIGTYAEPESKTEKAGETDEADENGRRKEQGSRKYALAEIDLKTGRHHQIRVQMAHHKMPLYGDRKYNTEWETYVLHRTDQDRTDQDRTDQGGTSFQRKSAEQPALCAESLSFRHPASGKAMTFEIKPQGEIFQIFNGGEV